MYPRCACGDLAVTFSADCRHLCEECALEADPSFTLGLGVPCEGCDTQVEAQHRTVDDVGLCTPCWDSHCADPDDGQDLPDNVLSFAPRSTGA